MPYVLKPNKLFVKNPDGDGFLPQNIVTDQATDDAVADIEAAGQVAVDRVNTAISNAQSDIADLESREATIASAIASMAELGTDTTLSVSGMAADAKAAGDGVAQLKSAIESIYNITNIADWEKGTFSTPNGSNYDAEQNFIRNQKKVGLSTGTAKIVCDSGYKFLLFAWDTNGTYIGSMKTGYVFNQSLSGYLPLTEYDCSMYPNYLVKIALRFEPSSSSITASDGAHCFVYNATDKTLSIENKSADAKATGDGIAQLKGALNYSPVEVEYNNTKGVFDSNSITYWARTSQPIIYLRCNPNETFEITKTVETPSYRMCYVTDDPAVGVAIHGYKSISAPNYNRTDTFVTGADAKYLLLQFGTYSGSIENLNAGVSVSKFTFKELDTINGELDTINGELDTINGELDHLVVSDLMKNPVDKFPVASVGPLYAYSTFSGWACPIGNPTNFDAVQFVVANRNTKNYIEKIRVQITEVNKDGAVLADVQITDAHVAPSGQKTIICRFPLIENANEDQLFFSYDCDQIITMIGGNCDPYSPPDYGRLAYSSTASGRMAANSFTPIVGEPPYVTKIDVKVGIFSQDLALTELQTQQVEELIADKPTPETTAPRIIVPNVFHAVVGDELQLFYRGIIEHPNPYNYNIQFTCNIGRNTSRYFTVKPTVDQVGDHTLTIRVRSMNDEILATATTIIRVHAVGSSPATEKTILCIGDSLTAGGVWPEEMMRRLTASDGTPVGAGLQNIVSIGTVHKNQTSYEGYGGWTWSRYISAPSATTTDMWVYATHDKDISDQHSLWKDANNNIWQMETIEAGRIKFTRYESHTGVMPTGSGTLTHYENATHTAAINFSETAYASGNPFWDATDNEVDFVKYCENNGFSGIDYVVTLLTWNSYGAFHATPEDLTIIGHVNAAKTMFRRLHEQYPNAKVKMMGIQLPSLSGGTGQSYGANSVYSNWYGLVRSVMGMNLAYKALAEETEFSSYVEFVDLSAQFDSEHNMPHATKPVNTRSTETEEVGTNGVHPSTVGYLQIGDAAYRAMMPEFLT